MPIESRLSDEMNVKSLSLEKPELESDLPFDPERDISQKDKQKILRELERLRSGNNIAQAFGGTAVDTKILFPKDYEQLNVGNREFNAIFGRYIIKKNSAQFNKYDFGVWSDLSNDGRIIKQLFPERQAELNLDRELFEDFNNALNIELNSQTPTSIYDVANFVYNVKILFPTEGKILHLPDWLCEKLQDDINWCRIKQQMGGDLALAVLHGKLLFPEKFSNFTWDPDDWKLMKASLKEKSQKGFSNDYANLAAKMKLLAMEDLRITDKGLEYSTPKGQLTTVTPSLPEAKKF